MHIAVGQKANEVQRGAAGDHGGDQVLPGLGFIDLAGLDGLVDQLGSLGIDLAAAQGVVADFAVAHVVVGGQADGGSVGLDDPEGIRGFHFIQAGRGGLFHHISEITGGFADAVHDDQYNRFLHC